MPAPSVRAVSTGVFGTSGTITANAPTRAVGDILIYVVASSATSTPTHSTPENYEIIDTAVSTGTTISRTSVFWKRCTSAAETIPSCTVTPTGTSNCHHFAGCISVQDCVDAGTPFENNRTNSQIENSVLDHTRVVSGSNRLSFLCTHHASRTATGVTENAADVYVSRYATDNSTGIDGFTSVFTFGPRGTVSDTVTVTFTSGGILVDISGVAFALLGQAYARGHAESATASDDAAYAHASPGGSLSDEQRDSTTASESGRFRQEVDLQQAADVVTLTDSQASTLVKGSSEAESASATESQISSQADQSYEAETATLSDDAGYTYQAASGAFQDLEIESTSASDDAAYTYAPSVGAFEDLDIESVAAGFGLPFRLDVDLYLPVESVTASDDAAYTYQAAGQPGAFEDAEQESATSTDPQVSRQAGGSSEADAATATDSQVSRQSGIAFEADSVTASDSEVSVQADRSTQVESTTSSDNAAYAYQAAGGVIQVAQAESVSATDALIALQRAGSSQVESAVGSDDAAYAWAGPGAFEEAELESATPNFVAAPRLEADLYLPVESATASDDAAYTYQAAGAGAQVGEIESVTASDNAAYSWQHAVAAYSGHEIESATASLDAPFALQAELEVPDEITTAADSQSSRQAARSSEIESAAASDNASYAWSGVTGTQYLESQRESATTSDPQRSVQAHRSFESDAAVATDTWQSYSAQRSSQIESAACSDSWDFTLVRGIQVVEVESAAASDVYAAFQAGTVPEIESASAQDIAAFTLDQSGRGSELETAQATDSYAFTLARPSAIGRFHVWNGSNWV